jgi:hypothetical protein
VKITLTWPVNGAQNGTFVLVDSPAAVPYTNFHIHGSRLIQEAQFFRGKARRFFDRGNAKTEITVDTTRQFANQVAVESFVLMHATQFPVLNSATGGPFLVTIVAGVSGAGSTITRYLKNAAVEMVSSSLYGCTGKFSYRLTGGAMTTTPN